MNKILRKIFIQLFTSGSNFDTAKVNLRNYLLSENDTRFTSSQNWLKINHLASLL